MEKSRVQFSESTSCAITPRTIPNEADLETELMFL